MKATKIGELRRLSAEFQGEPAGELNIPSLEEALDRIDELEKRIDSLEKARGMK